MTAPLIIDSFAGGGGASTGIEMALSRSPDYAIDHDAVALGMHAANHSDCVHLNNNVWQVDPDDVTKGRRVALAWFSPDCKHFSKAKGSKPVAKNIRDLAWVVVLWAKRAKPEVIILENVEEFKTWGPLGDDNKPIAGRSGETFTKWVKSLRREGYKVQWRELRACDYGAPTIRKRLFVIARRDGQPIVWPKPTHGPGLIPHVSAASIIDWTQPCPSIFDTSKQIMAKHGLRAIRPLAENTLHRIARGMVKYVIEADHPFFVSYAQHGGANRSAFDPLHTITASNKDQNCIVVPALQATFLASVSHGGNRGRREYEMDKPLGTITSKNNKALVTAFMAQHNTGVVGRDLRKPLSTITARGTQQTIVAAQMERGTSANANGVAAFLIKYYGQGIGAKLTDPMHTDTTRDRFGLVTVSIEGESWTVVDIGMRMLTPRERFRAQGFPEDYIIDRTATGKRLTKTEQGSNCGNSVSPPLARALVSANCELNKMEAEAAAVHKPALLHEPKGTVEKGTNN